MAQYPTTNLTPGMRGTEVEQLQDYLVSQGFMTQAQVNTGYGIYGPRTKAAVKALQESLGIDNSSGPGYWGPITIGALSEQSQPSSGNQYEGQHGTWKPGPGQSGDGYSGQWKPGYVPHDEDTSEQPWTPPDTTPSWMDPQDDEQPVSSGSQGTTSPIITPGGTSGGGGQGSNETIVGDTGGTGDEGTGNEGTGNEILDEILDGLNTIIENNNSAGNVINPDIELTPEEIQAFLDQAVEELDPYYSSYIESIKTDLTADIKQLQESYNLTKEQRLADFQASLAGRREAEATGGTIFSGGRMKRAQALQGQHERSLSALEAGAFGTARKLGSAAEQDIGSDAMGGNIPTVQTGSLSLMGEGQYVPISDRSLYELQGGVYGSKQQERTTAERLRASQLEQAERESRALNFYN